MRTLSLAVSTLIVASGLVAIPAAAPAEAACIDAGRSYYKISNIKTSRLATNLKSDYVRGPGTVGYSKNKSASTTVTGTTGVSAEAGIILAKASVSASVSLGKTWSKGSSWSYSKPVPRGKTARLVLFHESRSFTVRKYTIDGRCNSVHRWTRKMNAPRKSGANVWDLQYR